MHLRAYYSVNTIFCQLFCDIFHVFDCSIIFFKKTLKFTFYTLRHFFKANTNACFYARPFEVCHLFLGRIKLKL